MIPSLVTETTLSNDWEYQKDLKPCSCTFFWSFMMYGTFNFYINYMILYLLNACISPLLFFSTQWTLKHHTPSFIGILLARNTTSLAGLAQKPRWKEQLLDEGSSMPTPNNALLTQNSHKMRKQTQSWSNPRFGRVLKLCKEKNLVLHLDLNLTSYCDNIIDVMLHHSGTIHLQYPLSSQVPNTIIYLRSTLFDNHI